MRTEKGGRRQSSGESDPASASPTVPFYQRHGKGRNRENAFPEAQRSAEENRGGVLGSHWGRRQLEMPRRKPSSRAAHVYHYHAVQKGRPRGSAVSHPDTQRGRPKYAPQRNQRGKKEGGGGGGRQERVDRQTEETQRYLEMARFRTRSSSYRSPDLLMRPECWK